MSTTRITIHALQAATDTGHLEKALEAVPHVNSVEIDPATKEALIDHDGADPAELTAAVKSLGYAASAA